MTDRIQTAMNKAYDRWQKHQVTTTGTMPEDTQSSTWSKQMFWDHLDADERFAVFIGNFNYQVENGGFTQWLSNGYAEDEIVSFLHRACDRIATPLAKQVQDLLGEFVLLKGDYDSGRYDDEAGVDERYSEFSALDTRYYAINEQFMIDAEAYAAKEWGVATPSA